MNANDLKQKEEFLAKLNSKKLVNNAENILLKHIENYNKTASEIAKFRLTKSEVKMFVDAMEEHTSQFK